MLVIGNCTVYEKIKKHLFKLESLNLFCTVQFKYVDIIICLMCGTKLPKYSFFYIIFKVSI